MVTTFALSVLMTVLKWGHTVAIKNVWEELVCHRNGS